MTKFQVDDNREKLNFKNEVLKHFIFLIQEYGFKCIKTEITFVRYESEKIFINIYHGRGSYELGFEVGYKNDEKSKEVKYTLTDIIKFYDNIEFKPFQVTTYDTIIKFVPKMAEFVKKYAIPAIKGDNFFYEKLDKMKSIWFKKYMLEQNISKANEAWAKKNYKAFIEILNPYKNDLSDLYRKKLSFAQKNIKNH